MRFLANENFPLDAVEALRQNGHDVLWIRVESPGISDREVLSRAQAENRILLTFDKDFGELAFRSRLPASVGIILFSLHYSPTGKNLIVRTSQKTDCFSARSLDELLAKAFEDFPKSS
ncbi:DUF5615 family PIN-like protein [Microcystis sp. M049S2]|uniref:DUF5615 family PIN-like protein n=1 Tax=Microcystis sp. M049S2 TaxID=2771169 RepID=UPI00258BECD0|nr:DUF5615 family PIN-like protein [Microcystis sp. M049S2]